jgi:hypothetical protein
MTITSRVLLCIREIKTNKLVLLIEATALQLYNQTVKSAIVWLLLFICMIITLYLYDYYYFSVWLLMFICMIINYYLYDY